MGGSWGFYQTSHRTFHNLWIDLFYLFGFPLMVVTPVATDHVSKLKERRLQAEAAGRRPDCDHLGFFKIVLLLLRAMNLGIAIAIVGTGFAKCLDVSSRSVSTCSTDALAFCGAVVAAYIGLRGTCICCH